MYLYIKHINAYYFMVIRNLFYIFVYTFNLKQNLMKKFTLFFTLLILGSEMSFSQGTVTITPEYDEPYRNTWNGGVYAGLDLQNGSGGLYVGLNGRYTLGKIATFSTNIGYDLTKLAKSGGILSYDQEIMDKLTAYKNIELRGAYHFKDKEGTLNNKVKLGQSGNMKYSTSYETKVRNVYAFTASLNIQSRIYGQTVDSVQVIKVKDQNGADPGYINGIVGSQNNLLIGAGIQMGQYTFFKGKFVGGPINKNKRIKKSVVANFEFLMALGIGAGSEAYYKKDANSPLVTYKIDDVEKKRFGFRLTADYGSNKPGFFNRIEMGWRPGVYAPSKSSKYFNQAFIVYALGISI